MLYYRRTFVPADFRRILGEVMHSGIFWLPVVQGAREAVEEDEPSCRRGLPLFPPLLYSKS
jgi:hypothetical protein